MGERFVGVMVTGAALQSEGVDAVLHNLCHRAHATAVTVNTTVAAPSTPGTGSLSPPSDGGASVREFDRPQWGRTSLWTVGAPAHVSRAEYYADSPYSPRPATPLTQEEGSVIADFLQSAQAAGLQTFLQLSATTPPGLRAEDAPRVPSGRRPRQMARTGSLASSAVRRWNHALIRDLLAAYPMVDGFRLDFAEQPCYRLDETFTDFSAPACAWARRRGFDVDRVRADVDRLSHYLHHDLTNEVLAELAEPDRGRFLLWRMAVRHPGVLEWLRWKAELSLDLLADWRAGLDAVGGADKQLVANAFAPPFTLFTGFDFAEAGAACSAVAPKLYTMHWPMIIGFWAEELLGGNPELDEALLVRTLVNLFDLDDTATRTQLADYAYPEPDQRHPIPDGPLERKIAQVVHAAGAGARVHPLLHGYGPVDDFARRLAVVNRSAADGVWVNRYAYLSDEKLDLIGATT